MITLSESERVVIDLSSIVNTAEIQMLVGDNVIDLTDTAAVVIAKIYNEYINRLESDDHMRLYML